MAATIRRATTADAPALGVIHSSSWGELYPKALSPEVLAQLNADYMAHRWLWIAESAVPTQAFYRKQKYFPDTVRREGSLFETPLTEIRMAR